MVKVETLKATKPESYNSSNKVGCGSKPVETHYGIFCGAHQEMQCGNQCAPVTYKGTYAFTLYPCNAMQKGYQQPAKAAQSAEGGLELKLAPGSA